MISKSSHYALRAVIFIASISNRKEKVGVKEITTAIEAPSAFTAKVLQALTKKGIICATRGPQGGFYMEPYQLKQPILHIIQAVDGQAVFTGCVLGLKQCSSKNPCPIHDAYQDVRKSILDLFQKTTVIMLADKHVRGMKLTDTITWKPQF